LWFAANRCITASHAAGNLRLLMNLPNDLLAAACPQEREQIDEKLYFEVFALHPKQGYLVGVAALQRAVDGIELVTQALRGSADPLLGLLGHTLGRFIVVEDVKSRRLRNFGGASHVLNRWPSC
jgi:hypothetical protein